MSDIRINEHFFLELFRLCIKDHNFFKFCKEKIKYNNFSSESHKSLWKIIGQEYEKDGNQVSLGLLFQNQYVVQNDALKKLLTQIHKVDIPSLERMNRGLKEFIILSLCQNFYDNFSTTFNKKGKEASVAITRKFIEDVEKVQIIEELDTTEKIFGNFSLRNLKRKLQAANVNKEANVKIPTGIDGLDKVIEGIAPTDMLLFCAQSGKGKTRFLRHLGIIAARLGFSVLHFQLEGSKEECEVGYDAAWTASSHRSLEFGLDNNPNLDQLEKIAKSITGEIYVETFEQFNSVTVQDVENRVNSFEKKHGKFPDLILIDYLELLEPGDGKRYSTSNEGERYRRQAISRRLKNVMLRTRSRLAVPTQASTVSPELLNNPKFVMTRYNVSEFKALVDPFTIFLTYNQTKDELTKKISRIYVDKSRKSVGNKIISICQNYGRDKFYDRVNTVKEFGLLENTVSDG